MNSKLSLCCVLAAAVAGLAWAGTQNPQDPEERIAALEREVAALKELVAQNKTAGDEALAKSAAEQAKSIDAVLGWARAHALAGEALQLVLDDSRAKGFTAGINPDSRVVLLDGFTAFVESLKTPLPAAPAAPAPKREVPERRANPPVK
jgi:hypothetical protein